MNFFSECNGVKIVPSFFSVCVHRSSE